MDQMDTLYSILPVPHSGQTLQSFPTLAIIQEYKKRLLPCGGFLPPTFASKLACYFCHPLLIHFPGFLCPCHTLSDLAYVNIMTMLGLGVCTGHKSWEINTWKLTSVFFCKYINWIQIIYLATNIAELPPTHNFIWILFGSIQLYWKQELHIASPHFEEREWNRGV